MSDGLDLQPVTVRISNHFEGPNFVNGLALQTGSYRVIDPEHAILEFSGGFNPIPYVQIVEGTGFGVDAGGRYTGTITSYLGYERDNPENHWTFEGLDTALDRLNSLVSDPAVTFEDLLLIPLKYVFHGAQFDDVFICGSFDDIAYGYAGDDNYNGLAGDDTLTGNAGDDVLTGEDGNDLLIGGANADSLFGGRGDDRLHGNAGDDLASGGTGNDRIFGGGGADALAGDAGSDTLFGGTGADTLKGGGGADSLHGGAGDDRIEGGDSGDTIKGGLGDDLVLGGSGTNILYGQGGDDRVIGGADTDELFGGSGADRLIAGSGADFLNGGTGNDTLSANLATGAGDKAIDSFIFEAAFGNDVVTDFEIGFDGIILTAGITAANVATRTIGADVLVEVDFLGGQSILVEGVAGLFNPDIDIQFA